jgi:hypothetical protein
MNTRAAAAANYSSHKQRETVLTGSVAFFACITPPKEGFNQGL